MGSLQARLSKDDSRLYSANRDVAHNFRFIMTEVAVRLEQRNWEPLKDYLRENDVDDEQLGQACKAFIEFTASAVSNPQEQMHEALERVGWWNLPPQTHVALMAVLGTVMSGVYWTGVHEATLGGEGPCSGSMQELREAGARAAFLMTAPRYLRWLWLWRLKLAGMWSVIRGR